MSRIVPAERSLLLLWGFMGTGKSTVGARVAANLRVPFVDLDASIEAAARMSSREVFATLGEPAFRALEAVRLRELFLTRERAVIALGGGTLIDEALRREALSTTFVVCLDAEPHVILERVRGTGRPLLTPTPEHAVPRLLGQRRDAYAEAHAVVRTDELSPEEVAAAVSARWLGGC